MSNLLQTILISIIVIYLIDSLVKYFRDTYTTKKTKDLVGFHIKKYQHIMDNIKDTKKGFNHESTSEKLSDQELRYMNEELESLLLTELGSSSP